MPHVALVPFAGLRVADPELLALGLTLPGLEDRASALAELPALGLVTLAGMLPAHWACSYHPVSEAGDAILDEVLSERPALVAVSALTASIDDAYRFSDRVRRAGPRVVIGGLHATACADEAQAHCDAVVVGQGEAVWRQILADCEAGVLDRCYTAARGRSELDWPLPRFDLFGSQTPRYTLQTQRGCPLACDFCGASRLLGSYREKPLSAIRQELEAICRLNPRPLIELADDNTFVERRDADALCEALAACGARYFTESDWRIGERSDLLDRLGASGCAQVLVGIESLVFRYPGMGAKQAELDRIIDAVEAIQEAGVAVNGCFIVGADGETRASIDRLVEFILESPLADVQLTLQTPFPGTGLRRRLQRQGRLLERGWSHYTLLDVTCQPDLLSVEQLEQAFREAIAAVYSAPAAARRKAIRRQVWQRNARLRPHGAAP
jgi:radical SAM superfamily enzyme YgiQ (UPF0313 family)